MTKKEFMDALKAQTGALPQAERERLEQYYNEIIDDCIEDGVPEEEVIGAMGSVEDLVRELSPSPDARDFTASDERLDRLKEIRLRMLDANVTIARGTLDNGAAAQFKVSDPDAFKWLLSGDTLEIIENRTAKRTLLRGEQRIVTITIGDVVPDRLDAESRSGDFAVTDAAFSGLIRIGTASGDIRLEGTSCEGSVALTTRSGDVNIDRCAARGDVRVNAVSGDVEIRKVEATGELRVETASGDIELRGAQADRLSCRCVSGDVEIDDVEVASVEAHTVSGDAELSGAACAGALTVETTSGDIDVDGCAAADMGLVSVSGDIDARMLNLPGGLTINAKTRSGRLRLPKAWTPPEGDGVKRFLNARTVSGDVTVTVNA